MGLATARAHAAHVADFGVAQRHAARRRVYEGCLTEQRAQRLCPAKGRRTVQRRAQLPAVHQERVRALRQQQRRARGRPAEVALAQLSTVVRPLSDKSSCGLPEADKAFFDLARATVDH